MARHIALMTVESEPITSEEDWQEILRLHSLVGSHGDNFERAIAIRFPDMCAKRISFISRVAIHWAYDDKDELGDAKIAADTCARAAAEPCLPALRGFYDACTILPTIFAIPQLPPHVMKGPRGEFAAKRTPAASIWRKIANLMAALMIHMSIISCRAQTHARHVKFNGFCMFSGGALPKALTDLTSVLHDRSCMMRRHAVQYGGKIGYLEGIDGMLDLGKFSRDLETCLSKVREQATAAQEHDMRE